MALQRETSSKRTAGNENVIDMNPVSIIKHKRQRRDIDAARCFFCHSSSGDLRTASEGGKARTRTVAEQRRQLGDTSYVDVSLPGGRSQEACKLCGQDCPLFQMSV